MTPLTERVIELRKLRASRDGCAVVLKARREAFDRENAALIANLRDDAEAVATAETALKAVALERYDITKEKRPAPGIEIKIYREYLIDEAAGLAWATEKQLCLIPARLDVAAIKKLATVQPLSFVLVDEVPRVTIATDLSKLDFGAEANAPEPIDLMAALKSSLADARTAGV